MKGKSRLRYRKKTFRIDDSYNTVLCLYRAYEEETLTDEEKIEVAASLLVTNHRLYLSAMPAAWKAELVELILKKYVELPKRPPVRTHGEQSLDFWRDKGYILSSFQKDYGIDLIKEQGKMKWKEFIDLFQGLSEDTKIREVMRIRTMEIPAYNGRNGKEIQEISELKAYYMLPVKGGGENRGLTGCLTYWRRRRQERVHKWQEKGK